MPSGTETITASPNPYSTRPVVAPRSLNSWPEDAISSPASSTEPGDGRKVGSTTALALSAAQTTNGIANDNTISVHRAPAEIGVRMDTSAGAGFRPARRGSAFQA